MKELNCLLLKLYFYSIILESDPSAIAFRVAVRNDDIPIGEQTVAQVKVLLCFINFTCFYEKKIENNNIFENVFLRLFSQLRNSWSGRYWNENKTPQYFQRLSDLSLKKFI